MAPAGWLPQTATRAEFRERGDGARKDTVDTSHRTQLEVIGLRPRWRARHAREAPGAVCVATVGSDRQVVGDASITRAINGKRIVTVAVKPLTTREPRWDALALVSDLAPDWLSLPVSSALVGTGSRAVASRAATTRRR